METRKFKVTTRQFNEGKLFSYRDRTWHFEVAKTDGKNYDTGILIDRLVTYPSIDKILLIEEVL